jgi:hypothetical protein
MRLQNFEKLKHKQLCLMDPTYVLCKIIIVECSYRSVHWVVHLIYVL